MTVRNHSGVPLAASPVRGGVPFARGVLRDGVAMRLVRGDGSEVPCRARPTAHWYDGSVKWLLVDSQVDLGRDETLNLRLTAGKPGNKPTFGYSYALAHGAPGDRGGRSLLMLFEDGKPLRPHEAHVAILAEGQGRFSHWDARGLLFSSSDNTDPRTNGREYKVIYPWPKPK